MFKKSFLTIGLLFVGMASGSAFASFGPWAHTYFQKGGLLSCSEEKPCLAPRMDDIATLKSDWMAHEEIRLNRVNRLEVLAREAAEKILEIGQTEFQKDEDSVFAKTYMDYGSRLLTNIGDREIESMRLLVSQSSPMFLKIEELEAKLVEWQNQIDQQEDPDLKEGLTLLRNEKYKELLESEEMQNTLEQMESLQKQVFPKGTEEEGSESRIVDGLMNLSFDFSEFVTFSSCPKKIEEKVISYLGRVQFSEAHRKEGELDPVRNQNFIRFILVGKGFGGPLKVSCKKGSLLAKVKASYGGGHRLEIKYKTKNDSNGVTQYRVPSKSEVLGLLK